MLFASPRKKNNGISLVEILVAMLLLSLVMIGLVNVFITSKRLLMRGQSKITALEFARSFIEPLNNAIRQDTWNHANNDLRLGTRTGPYQVINGINYTSVYNVTDVPAPSAANLRRVKVDMRWNDTTP
ncbi:MAG: prepilin-type N-terminal cleavage/methylation domain-containing protein [Candidatus Omnitrophica bacterium]|nr:prepilin-type N-terminal cleavage/methylation domain-containing protein [Candidatus Omnitrophota bacterium]